MAEQQTSVEQTSTDERSQPDQPHGYLPDQSPATEQTSEPTEMKDLPAWAQKQIRDARKDAETARKRLQEIENAGKTEEERRQAEYEAAIQRAQIAEVKLRETSARAAVTEAAIKANAVSPNLIYALAKDQLEFDEDGGPTNVDVVLAEIKKQEPKLFPAAPGTLDGGTKDQRPGNASAADFNSLIRDKMRRR